MPDKKLSIYSNFEIKNEINYLLRSINYAGGIYSRRILEIALDHYTQSEIKTLLELLLKTAGSNDINVTEKMLIFQKNYFNEANTLYELGKHFLLNKILTVKIVDHLSMIQQAVLNEGIVTTTERKLQELKKIFRLSKADMEILKLYYLINTNIRIPTIQQELGQLLNGSGRFSITVVSILCNLNRLQVRNSLLNSNSGLIKAGLIEIGGWQELTEEIILFLDGKTDKPLSDFYYEEYKGEALPLKKHIIKQDDIMVIRDLIRHKKKGQRLNILFYGKAGLGKTEFARSLAKNLHHRLYEIKNSTETISSDAETAFRFKAFLACQSRIGRQKAIILIDEADALINSQSNFFSRAPVTDKSKINMLLDQTRTINIWITNRYDGIAESTKRRFDYALHFGKPKRKQRMLIWENRINHYNLSSYLSKSLLAKLSAQFDINAGGIDVALRNIQGLSLNKKSEEEVYKTIVRILNAQITLISGKEPLKAVESPNDLYDLNGLSIDGNIPHLIHSIKGFVEYWGKEDTDHLINNINILLYGPPGTGKSAFARYIAQTIDRRLLIKRASDLLNPYVGMTEMRIREAFKEAEDEQAILFLDEADSFFNDRGAANHTWEVSKVNELLTNMENFNGLLVCATNFKEILDSASLRRFNFKLRFDYLKPEGNILFFKRFFGRLIKQPLNDGAKNRLTALSCLTPGDFKTVYEKYLFYRPDELTAQTLINDLENEVKTKNEKINRYGFQ